MSGPQPGGSAPGGNKTGEAAAKAKAWLGKAWTASRALATNKTRLEIFVEDALNDVPWGPTGAQMNEISEASFDAEKFAQVWRVILRRFESEPAQWRRCYKALLLTEHLVKNSSQHVVQTILDACGVIEGLKGFKYLDDKGKDQGINVSNRAKELVILLGDSERIRAERAKARSLKDKFKGVSREQMAASAGGSPGGAYAGRAGSGFSGAPATSSPGGSSYYSPASAASEPRLGGMEDFGASTHFEGMARPKGRQALPAGERGGASEEERDMHSARASPGKGYGALPAAGDDPVSATARRIESLRQAGAFLHEDEGEGMGARGGSAGSLAAAGSAAGVPTSRTYDNLAVAPSGGSQTSKPSLHDLMARKSAGPKKLQDVRVNPAIASAFASAKLAPQPAAAPSSPAKPMAAPAPIAKLAPPPAVRAAQVAQPAPPSPTSPAALAEVLGAPAQLPAAAAASPSAAASSGAGSPWSAASPMAQRGPEFDAFGSGTAAGHTAGAPFAAFPETAATKLGGSPAGVISLTASTAGTAHHADSQALPAYLFAEPTPPAYSSANSWGSHVGGAAPAVAHGSVRTAAAHKPVVVDDAADAFAEFDPFKQ